MSFPEFIHDGHTTFEVEMVHQDEERTVVHIALCGINRKVRNDGSTTTYQITEGAGMMVVDDKEILLEPSVEVIVERGSEYYDVGNFKAFAVSEPPFDESTVVVVED